MHSTVAVTAPADSFDLTVIDTVKLELGITDDSEDVKLTGWIRQASQIAATYCKRVFAQEEVQETFRPGPGRNGCATSRDFLALSRFPVASIASVIEDGTPVVSPDYDLDAETGFLYRASGGSPSPWSFASSIVVVYVGGFELLETLPHDVERAVISMVRDFRSDGTRDPNLIEKEIVGVSRYRWWAPTDSKVVLPVEVSGLLDPYVRRQGWMK